MLPILYRRLHVRKTLIQQSVRDQRYIRKGHAGVATAMAEGGVNVSYMTVTRTGQGQEAIMAIGVDGTPPSSVLEAIPGVPGIIEFTIFSEKGIKPLA